MLKIIHRLLLGVLIISSDGAFSAERLDPADVPAPLKPWVGWALHDQGDRTCPFMYNNSSFTNCAWSSVLRLNLNTSGTAYRRVKFGTPDLCRRSR